MSRTLGTAGKAIWMVLGNGIYAGCQALNLIILNRWLGIEAAGVFTLGLAISAPIMLFSNFGIRTQLVTDVKSNYPLKTYVQTRQMLSVCGFLTCIIVAFILGYSKSVLISIVLISASKVIECSVDLVQGLQQKRGAYRSIALSQIMKGVAGCIGLSTGIAFYGDMVSAFVLYMLSWLVVYIGYDNRILRSEVAKDLSPTRWVAFEQMKHIVAFGFPLAIASLFTNFNVSIPRIVLSKSWDISDLGVYGTLAAVIQIGTLVANSLGQAVLPRMAVAYSDSKINQYVKVLKKGTLAILLLSLTMTGVLYLAADYILRILFVTPSSNYADYLLWMSVGAFFQYICTFSGHAVGATRRNYSLLKVHSVSLFFTLLCSFILIPKYGIAGAIASPVAGAVAGAVVYMMVLVSIVKNEKKY